MIGIATAMVVGALGARGASADTTAATEAAGADPTARVDEMMVRAKMVMEPSRQMQAIIDLLDERLTAEPRDARAWRRLAEALAVGFARSRVAPSVLEARKRALALDPSDCHLAALVARADASVLARWREAPSPCAEMLLVMARGDGADEVALLERSRAAAPTAEGLVALGIARLRAGDLARAEEAYAAALKAPAAFPEDWRVDGWTAVHARLGLAVVASRRGQAKRAREHRKALREWWRDPGPWHDLSDEERRWARAIGERL